MVIENLHKTRSRETILWMNLNQNKELKHTFEIAEEIVNDKL